nr:MAG TPA: Hint (Hedgehog/Intein) domain C-terminal region [Bacteriophage sp.]
MLHFGIHGIIRYIKPTNRIRKYKDHFISDKNGEYRLEIADVVSLGRFSQHIKLTVSRKSAALDLIYLFIQSELPKYNKYLCGIVADKITNITDIGIQDIYNITAKEQHNYIVNGIVTHNTGGDEESNFATLKDMFYKPKGYNCIEL